VIHLQARDDDRYEDNDSADEAARLQPGRQVALIQRDPDWFRVEVPARMALRATIFHSTEALALTAWDPDGARPDDLEVRDEGRVVHLLAGASAREVHLEVGGDDAGVDYQLLVEARIDDRRDDPRRPDSAPAQATPLAGRGPWRLPGLQRDDDYVRVEVPAGAGLVARVEGEGRLRVVATDPLGARLVGAVEAEDGRQVSVPAGGARAVLLRVSGDDAGARYVLLVALEGTEAEDAGDDER
jgi:hypothetical protein